MADLEAPQPKMVIVGYAVRMKEGPFVGIWQTREVAELVCSKQPPNHGDYVLPVYAPQS